MSIYECMGMYVCKYESNLYAYPFGKMKDAIKCPHTHTHAHSLLHYERYVHTDIDIC